ncbi:MAG TPA: hypothetical protein PLX03_00520 [Candidatus Hydrogenedentes bacterium]|nr:hypothetical protein [Candidatus Hydrogenedentota bacterium]
MKKALMFTALTLCLAALSGCPMLPTNWSLSGKWETVEPVVVDPESGTLTTAKDNADNAYRFKAELQFEKGNFVYREKQFLPDRAGSDAIYSWVVTYEMKGTFESKGGAKVDEWPALDTMLLLNVTQYAVLDSEYLLTTNRWDYTRYDVYTALPNDPWIMRWVVGLSPFNELLVYFGSSNNWKSFDREDFNNDVLAPWTFVKVKE